MATDPTIATCRTVDPNFTTPEPHIHTDTCGCDTKSDGPAHATLGDAFRARVDSFESSRGGGVFSDLKEVPNLLRKLGSDVTLFVDQKVALLKAELRDELKGYLKDGVMLAIGGVLLTVAFLIINIALGFFIARMFPFSLPIAYGLGFLILGLIYVGVGGLIIRASMKDLGKRHLKPERTVKEFERDKQWVQNELV